jgi:hypothetical protein
MTSSDFEPEKRQPYQGSIPLDIEKTDDVARDPEVVEPANEPTSEYPHGTRLVIIMVSLMLSTFLAALHNVSDWLL